MRARKTLPMFYSTGDSKDLPNKMTLQAEHERVERAETDKGETTAQRNEREMVVKSARDRS